MASFSNQHAQLIAVKKEVLSRNEEYPRAQLVSSSEAAEAEEDGIYYLSGKPYFDVIMQKSHLDSLYQLNLPSKMLHLLPRATVPVVLRHGGKNWNLSYIGDVKSPRFDNKWKTFATENHLVLGDACVFELMENSNTILRFKVHILRKQLPPELRAMIDSIGDTSEKPIVID